MRVSDGNRTIMSSNHAPMESNKHLSNLVMYQYTYFHLQTAYTVRLQSKAVLILESASKFYYVCIVRWRWINYE
jgi:general stress protein 26